MHCNKNWITYSVSVTNFIIIFHLPIWQNGTINLQIKKQIIMTLLRIYHKGKSQVNHITIKSDIDNKICHLIIQGLINVRHVIWILVLNKNLRNIEKKNMAVRVLVIVKIKYKMVVKEYEITSNNNSSLLFINTTQICF